MPHPDFATISAGAWSETFHPRLRRAGSIDEAWLTAVRDASADLPVALLETLHAMRDHTGPVGLHLHGLPVPTELPPTPSDCLAPPPRADRNGEFWLSVVGSVLGDLFSHAEICGGQLIHHIAPVAGKEHTLSGECSLSPIRMHTDGASHPMPPRFILLWCHRGATEVATYVASMSSAARRLPDDVVARLRAPTFLHQIDHEFGHADSERTGEKPVLHGVPARLCVDLDVDLVCSPDRASADAVLALEAAATEVGHAIILQPGDVLVIDNRRSLHARDPFPPRYDGTDRWLQSAYTWDRGIPVPDGIEMQGRIAAMATHECDPAGPPRHDLTPDVQRYPAPTWAPRR